MAQGIILAAGYSSRAVVNKMLLELNNKPLIIHAIEGMSPFVTHIFVVTGYYHQEIYNIVKDVKGVTCIHNTSYDKGMFSSVQVGVSAASDDFFILPGDCPFVKPSTYDALIKGDLEIRVPSYKGRKGHPLFITNKLRQDLLKESSNSNLKVFRNRHTLEVIPVKDNYILTDIDTIKQFEAIKKLKGRECENGH